MSDEYTDQETLYDPAMERLVSDAGLSNEGGFLGYNSGRLMGDEAEKVMYDQVGGYSLEEGLGGTLSRLQSAYDMSPNSPDGQAYLELVNYVKENPPSGAEAAWDKVKGFFGGEDDGGGTLDVIGEVASHMNGAEQAGVAFSMAGVDPANIQAIQQGLAQNPQAMQSLEAAITSMGNGEGGNLDMGALKGKLEENKELLQTLGNRPQEFVHLISALGPEATANLLNTAGGEGADMSAEELNKVVNTALDHPGTVGAVLSSDVFSGLTQDGLSLNPDDLSQSLQDAPLSQKVDLLYDVAVAQNPALGVGREEFQQKLQSAIEQKPELEGDINEMVSGMSEGVAGGDLGQTLESLEQVAPQFASFASSDLADNLLSNPEAMHNALNLDSLNFDQKLETAFAVIAPDQDISGLQGMLDNNEGVKVKLEEVVSSLTSGEGGTPDLQNIAGQLQAAEPILTAAAKDPAKFETLMESVETEDLKALVSGMGGMEGGGDPALAGNFFQMAMDNPEIAGSLLSSEAFDKLMEDGSIDFNNLAGELESVSLGSKVDLLFELAASAITGEGPEAEAEKAKLLEDKERVSEQLNNAMAANPELEGLINAELSGQIQSAMTGGGEGGSGDMLKDLGATAQQYAAVIGTPAFEDMLAKDALTKAAIRRAQEVGEDGQPIGIMSAAVETEGTYIGGQLFKTVALNNDHGLMMANMVEKFGGMDGLAEKLQQIMSAQGSNNGADANMMGGVLEGFLGEGSTKDMIMGIGDKVLGAEGMALMKQKAGETLDRTDQAFLAVHHASNNTPSPLTPDELYMDDQANLEVGYNFLNGYNSDGSVKTTTEDPDGPEGPQEPVEVAYSGPAEWVKGPDMGMPIG
jgi:hypothetical protein